MLFHQEIYKMVMRSQKNTETRHWKGANFSVKPDINIYYMGVYTNLKGEEI